MTLYSEVRIIILLQKWKQRLKEMKTIAYGHPDMDLHPDESFVCFCLSVCLSIFSLVRHFLLSLLSPEQVLLKHIQEGTAFADPRTLNRHFLSLDVATHAFNSSTKEPFLWTEEWNEIVRSPRDLRRYFFSEENLSHIPFPG